MNEVGTTTDVTGLTNVTTINENSYNSSGQRISKSEDDSTENYFYSGGALIYTKGSTGLMLTENILDLNGKINASTRFDDEDESTSQTGWEGEYFFYHYDIRGSVTAIVDPEGNSVKEYAYDEFGNLSESEEATFDNEVTFTGSITDTSTGLQYMNARFYEPTTGRFITQDSYSGNAYDPWTQHLYAYCGNNPVNMIDPTGHSFADISARARLRLLTSAPTPVPTPSPEEGYYDTGSGSKNTSNDNSWYNPADWFGAGSASMTRAVPDVVVVNWPNVKDLIDVDINSPVRFEVKTTDVLINNSSGDTSKPYSVYSRSVDGDFFQSSVGLKANLPENYLFDFRLGLSDTGVAFAKRRGDSLDKIHLSMDMRSIKDWNIKLGYTTYTTEENYRHYTKSAIILDGFAVATTIAAISLGSGVAQTINQLVQGISQGKTPIYGN